MNWYLCISGEALGPLSKESLALLLKDKRINAGDYVWRYGLNDWKPLMDFDEFAAYFQQRPRIPVPTDRREDSRSEPSEMPPPAPEPRGSRGPALKAVPAVEKPAPLERPAPAPAPVERAAPAAAAAPAKKQHEFRARWRVPIDATVQVEGYGSFKAVDISEGGLMMEGSIKIPVGSDLKLMIQSSVFPRPLDMTAILARLESGDDESHCYGVQFTKVNPAHKRVIAAYVKIHTLSE